MGTVIRSEVSKKNKYYLDKNRTYELKHFCLQYSMWKKAYNALDSLSKRSNDLAIFSNTNDISDPTAKCAIARNYYKERMDMVEKAIKETDSDINDYLLLGVTEGLSYPILVVRYNIPCSKEYYYKQYRKFFYILSGLRN